MRGSIGSGPRNFPHDFKPSGPGGTAMARTALHPVAVRGVRLYTRAGSTSDLGTEPDGTG